MNYYLLLLDHPKKGLLKKSYRLDFEVRYIRERDKSHCPHRLPSIEQILSARDWPEGRCLIPFFISSRCSCSSIRIALR